MPQIKLYFLFKIFYIITIILFCLTTFIISQDGPKTLYNLPPIPDEGNHYFLNSPIVTSTEKVSLSTNKNIPTRQLPLFHEPLGQIFQFPLSQVPFFDRYNEANMKSELPPLPEESLKGYYDSDGMFVPNQPKEVEQNKPQILLPKNQMAAAATFISTKNNQSQNNDNSNSEEDIPEDIFPEPIQKKDSNSQRDSIEKDFIISRSNLFIDGFGGDNNKDKEIENSTEETIISHVTPSVIENHGDLSSQKKEIKIENEKKKIIIEGIDKSKMPSSTNDVTIAPMGSEKQFQNSFMTTMKRKFYQKMVSPLTQQFVRTTLSPKMVLRNQIKNTQPQYRNLNTGNGLVSNLKKNSFQSSMSSNNNNNNNNIRFDGFLKKIPSSQSQFDLPLPSNDNNNNNNNRVIKGSGAFNKKTSLKEQPINNKITNNSIKNNGKINVEASKNMHNERKNLPPIPSVSNPSIPNEKNPSDISKKKSKVPGKINLPTLVSLPSPIVKRLGNGEEQKNNNFVRNGAVTQQNRIHIPKTVIRTTQIDIRNPTDSMFTNDLDWFDWEMYQKGRNLGFLPPNMINHPMLLQLRTSNTPANNKQLSLQSPPVAINPNTFLSKSTFKKNGGNQQPRASGAQQLPVQVPAANEEIPPDNVILTNPPQLELNLPGYTKQTPFPQRPLENVNQYTNENLVPFENTNTGRVPTSQLTTGLPYQNNNYNSNYNNRNLYNTNNNNYNRQWNNNNNNNNNNYNRNYYQQSQNNQPSLLNLFNVNPFSGLNLFG
uniref:Myb domain-containing protein n=1 Tax=Strongyloides stercoralis TaxID=6248 RepID=A0A0K0EQF0_STRER